MKLWILVCGLCGLASAFLGGDSSVWIARGAMMPSVILYIGGFALAAGVALWRLKRPPMQRHHAIVCLIGTACTMFWMRGAFHDLFTLAPLLHVHTLASILFSIGFYGGALTGIYAVAKPDAV